MPSLHFKGKTFVDNHHLSVPFRELRPVAGKGTGKTASLHDNLIIHGDNLAALKALLPTFHNKLFRARFADAAGVAACRARSTGL